MHEQVQQAVHVRVVESEAEFLLILRALQELNEVFLIDDKQLFVLLTVISGLQEWHHQMSQGPDLLLRR